MKYFNNPDYTDTRGAAALCGLQPMTMHNYRHFGRGPASVKDGNRVFYKVADVTEWNSTRSRRGRRG
jgi:hypothetical protein